MKKSLLFSSLILCVGSLMAQTQQIPTVEERMQQHLAEELKRHGISDKQPERPSDHAPATPAKAVKAVKAVTAAPTRAMQEEVQLCDSLIRYSASGEPEYKQEYTYNAAGQRTSRLEYWMSNGEWALNYKSEYDYDSNGHVAVETTYSYRRDTETWQESYRYEYAYDEQGHQLSYVSSRWNGESWEPSYKVEYVYDANGYQTGYISYNSINGELIGSSKSEYSYDDKGRQTSYAYYYWSNGAWYGNWKNEVTYDDFGNQTSYVSYIWEDGAWVGSNKSEYTYDAMGNQLGYTHFLNQNGEWVFSSGNKREYTYDEKGFPASSINYYSSDGTTWSTNSKYEYTYDANGNKLSEIYSWWRSDNESWQTSSKREFTYDARGNQLTEYSYNWSNLSDWNLSNTVDMTYDSNDRQTSYISYYWSNGEKMGQSKYEYAYNESGRILGETHYYWYEGDWAISSKSEYSYDANGNQTGSAYANARDAYSGPVTLKVDLSKDPLVNYIDQQNLLFYGSGYKVNALYVDEYVGEEPIEEEKEFTLWENNSIEPIDWNGIYRFSNEYYATGEQIYAFPFEDWNDIKEGTVRVDLELLKEDPNIRITTGWWSAAYGGEDEDGYGHNCLDLVQTDADGSKYIMLNIKEEGTLYNDLDNQHLLFTGDGYKLLGIRVSRVVPIDLSKTLWENDGSLGGTSWSDEYRFSSEMNSTGEEKVAFSIGDWNKIKNGTFYVDVEGAQPQIRVTTGWWSTTWTGADILPGNDLLTDNGDGTWTLAVNLEGDPILDVLDEQHLLFTGGGYSVLRIRVGETNPEDWVHRCIWQSDRDDYIDWNSTYQFGQEGHESECLATFNETDWKLIKRGYLSAEIETKDPTDLSINITSGRWSSTFTGSTIYFGSHLLSGKVVPVLRGESKYEYTFDDKGNIESYTSYRWNWDEQAWEISYYETYFYANNHVTDINEIVTDVRSRMSKQMRDGQVFIVVGDKTYTVDGKLVK